MKALIFSVFTSVLTLTVNAQTGIFSHDNVPYTNQINGRALAPDSVWDDPIFEWAPSILTHRLNFPFYAEGFNLDTFLIGDGYITNLDSSIEIGNFSDLMDKGYGGRTGPKSKITLHRLGAAPNRIVVIQWANHGFYGDFDLNGQCKDSGHMQLWIYETGKKIEIHFGKSYIADFANTMADYTLMGYSVSDGVSYSGITLEGNPNNPSLGSDIDNSLGLTSYPANGKRYTFTFSGTAGTRTFLKKGTNFWYTGGVLCFRGEKTISYILFDAAGRQVKNGTATNGDRISQGLKPGVYVLQVFGKSGRSIQKIVVE
jgi:hypothetical protein